MKKSILSISMLAASVMAAAQDSVSVSGIVTDAATGRPLAGVIVEAYGNRQHTTMTDDDGRYMLRLPAYVSSVSMRVDGYQMLQCRWGAMPPMWTDVCIPVFSLPSTTAPPQHL